MRKPTRYTWYADIKKENKFMNWRIFERLGNDEGRFSEDKKCFDKDGLEIVRPLIMLENRRELRIVMDTAKEFKASVQIFVQEGDGKIRAFHPHKKNRKAVA